MSETSHQPASPQEATAPENQAGYSSSTSGQGQQDIIDQLLKPEVQESLTVLVENLPKLAELTTILTKSYDLAQSVITDQVLINDFKGGFQEFVKPLEEKAKEYASTAIEAKDRAETTASTIGLFGLLRMPKDPQVQKVFRFIQAYLDLSEEHSKRKEQDQQQQNSFYNA